MTELAPRLVTLPLDQVIQVYPGFWFCALCGDGHELGEWTTNGPGKRVRRCKECVRIKNGAVRRYKPRVKK